MKDKIQALANQFCAEFGFAAVKIPFTSELSQADINIYNYLLSPAIIQSPEEKHILDKLNRLLAEGKHAAGIAYAWKVAGSLLGHTYKITESSAKLLRQAIEICERKEPKELSRKELEATKEIAAKIGKFHASGRAAKVFKDLVELVTKNVGKMPLINAKPSNIEEYVHEAIHFVLAHNELMADDDRFNEGLCSFLHLRFRGDIAMNMYRPPSMCANYLNWVPFFRNKFKNIQNQEIGPLLKANLSKYLREFRRRFG